MCCILGFIKCSCKTYIHTCLVVDQAAKRKETESNGSDQPYASSLITAGLVVPALIPDETMLVYQSTEAVKSN